jgi:hypothetical protein
MSSLTHQSPDLRTRPTLLASPPEWTGAAWSAPIRIPLADPFFFDHPLDHVPGLLSIFGLLDLFSAVTGSHIDSADERMLVELAFPAICELDRPVMLSVRADDRAPGRFLVRAEQDDVTGCEGWFELVHGISLADEQERNGLCQRELVHRGFEDNVLLGAVPDPGGLVVPMVSPSAGHYLEWFGRGYSVRSAIEASRQFTTLLMHQAAGKPLDTQLIWLEFSADLPCVVGPAMATGLRWRPQQLNGSRVTLTFDLIGPSSVAIGSFRYRVAAVSQATYRRFRSGMATQRNRS